MVQRLLNENVHSLEGYAERLSYTDTDYDETLTRWALYKEAPLTICLAAGNVMCTQLRTFSYALGEAHTSHELQPFPVQSAYMSWCSSLLPTYP